MRERQNVSMNWRFAFSGLVCGIVACGGANSTDLFSGGSNGGGGRSLDGSSSADGSGGGGGNQDSGGGGGSQDSGGGGPTDSGTTKDAGGGTGTCTVDKAGVASGCNNNPGYVCVSNNCMTGVCQKVTVGASDFNPVCGCDTVNYWNGATASDFVAAVKGSGVCASPALCNGAPAGSAKCSVVAAADCAFDRPDVAGTTCGATVRNPTCWGMPQNCPTAKLGVNQCLGGNCESLCDAIKNQTPYRVATPACTVN